MCVHVGLSLDLWFDPLADALPVFVGSVVVQLHLEKKEPLKRIWAKVFVEDEDEE